MRQVARAEVQRMQWPILEPVEGAAQTNPVALSREVCVVGDRARVNLPLPSPLVSRTHALFVNDDDAIYVRDLASRNHVYLNETPIREAVLEDGDVLRIGPFSFRCQSGFAKPHGGDGAAPDALLRGLNSSTRVDLDGRTIVIGRRRSCDVQLSDEGTESAHAVIFKRGGRRFLRDLRSRTGTFVNGRAAGQVELSPGDTIRVGKSEFRYETNLAHAADEAEHAEPIELQGDSSAAQSKARPEAPAGEPSEIPVVPSDLIPLVDERADEETAEPEPTEAEPGTEPVMASSAGTEPEVRAGAPSDDLIPLAVEPMPPVGPAAEAHEVRATDAPVHRPREPEPIAPPEPQDPLRPALEPLAAQSEPEPESDSQPEPTATPPEPEPFPVAHRDVADDQASRAASTSPPRAEEPRAAEAESHPGQTDRKRAEEAFSGLIEELSDDVARIQSTWKELKTSADDPAPDRLPGLEGGEQKDSRRKSGQDDAPPRTRTHQPD